jgi:cyclase
MTLTRRDFLGASALGLLAGLAPRLPAGAQQFSHEFVALRRGAGIFTARGGTIGWLANRDGTLVVDSQFPDTARLCLDGLRDRGARPVDALVNTHHHGDHTGGNGVFREAAGRIVAHVRVPELQRRAAAGGGSEDAQTYADTTFEDDWTVEVGDETVRAKHYGAAHTGGDCTVFFERADVVHMGDLVFNRAYPFIDRGGGASVAGWISLLEAVAAEHGEETLYVFGHGRREFGVTGRRADVLVQRDFLAAVLETAERAAAAGGSREEAVAVERLPGFADHAPLADWLTLGAALGAAYDEVTGAAPPAR